MRDAEIAWAAGLFEGEGCIYFFRQKHHVLTHVRMSIQMTDPDVLDKFCQFVECGKVGPQRRYGREHHKPAYVWQISNRPDIERLLLAFKPWFGQRRNAKADVVLAEIARLNVTCEQCGTAYRAKRLSKRFFCSTLCRNRWYYLTHRPEKPTGIGRPRTL